VGAAGGRIAVEPAVRVEVLRTEPLADASAGGTPVETPARTEALWSPRLSGRALAGADVAIKASAGRYARVPTALELFGDRGYVVGRPDLRSEHGWVGDAGLVWAPAAARGPLDRIYVETAGFWARPVDAIVLVTTGGLVARPVNLPGADLRGAELVVSARLARTVTVTSNYTRLDATVRSDQASLDGKRLPGRPRHAAYLRIDAARLVAGRLVALFGDAAFSSGSFLDETNLSPVPARLLVGAGAKLELGAGLAVAVEVKNLADARVEQVPLDPPPRPDLASVPRALADFAGYPLPGRAVYLRLDWTHR